MNALRSLMTKFLTDQSGATAIEYGFIALLMSVTIVASATVIGTKLSANWIGKLASNM